MFGYFFYTDTKNILTSLLPGSNHQSCFISINYDLFYCNSRKTIRRSKAEADVFMQTLCTENSATIKYFIIWTIMSTVEKK